METRTDISADIDDLKKILTDLRATGDNGFEGLIGTVLSEIAGVPFRLAGSGSQFGVDGKSTYADDGICFECKRYKNRVPKAEIMSKIGELSIGGSDIDLWVLCVTSKVRSQIADEVSKFDKTSAISTLILDWSENDLPPLAVALAMASAKVQDFLRNHTETPESLTKVEDALATVANDPSFNGHAERIRAILRDPTLGMATARQTNAKWLTDTFSSKQLAQDRFSQPLAPSDAANGAVLLRDDFLGSVHPFLTGEPSREVLYVIGDEGNGKSWLVALSWLSVEEKPLMVVLNPNAFHDTAEQNDVQELLIPALIKQTGDYARGVTKNKWDRILKRWRKHPAERLCLAVLIDGVNQRPEKDWARIAEKFASELDQIGGQLIMTVRTQYYRNRVQRRFSRAHKEVEIPKWTKQERDGILADRGIIATTLQPKVADSFLNPRLLGIALKLLEGADIAGLEELSVNHLLFEHIRSSERNASVQQSFEEFVMELRRHADEVISRVRSPHRDDITVFDYDLQAVAEGRFYRIVEGYPSRYKLDEDGLRFAISFAVIDRLYSASRTNRDLDEAIKEIIEPIAALDRTANVVLAALTVTCLDSGDPKIAATLIQVFADLQNPDENEFAPFARLARTHPAPFTEAAYNLCLSGGHQTNFDWVQKALMLAREDEGAWEIIFKKVQTWLSSYSLAPGRGLFPSSFYTSSEKKKEKYKEKKRKIRDSLEALSEVEKKILTGLTKADGDLNPLSRLAFVLLTDKPIEPAAQSLVQWCFANALNPSLMPSDHKFRHLVRFNRVDWSDARVALLKEVDVLKQKEISVTGKWALVNVLQATGNTEDAKQARILVEELTRDQTHFSGWRLVEKFCAADPCDPTSEKP
ncbi:MAG: restriction endonuclease, partial [Gemmatimonadetes bacterium]|nr:restriction endonuclease [Gemmatimonadota bacterium]